MEFAVASIPYVIWLYDRLQAANMSLVSNKHLTLCLDV